MDCPPLPGFLFASCSQPLQYVVDLGRAPDMLKLQLVLEELTGARTVPRIYIGGVCIGGLSDMTREHESGALRERLQRAAAL
ncbi:unnamed protein product [Rangifer tarandus platyrhynchus]|uniref:Glutaredoxin (Thioltransferase) n=1 Tax=Rangifer tarandus platyrhynchus TaxID=3082113 RepID=A0ABN8XKN2_RANTA|nr:unnamed protein product [Rangifer tarandus platyrhynchus]